MILGVTKEQFEEMLVSPELHEAARQKSDGFYVALRTNCCNKIIPYEVTSDIIEQYQKTGTIKLFLNPAYHCNKAPSELAEEKEFACDVTTAKKSTVSGKVKPAKSTHQVSIWTCVFCKNVVPQVATLDNCMICGAKNWGMTTITSGKKKRRELSSDIALKPEHLRCLLLYAAGTRELNVIYKKDNRYGLGDANFPLSPAIYGGKYKDTQDNLSKKYNKQYLKLVGGVNPGFKCLEAA